MSAKRTYARVSKGGLRRFVNHSAALLLAAACCVACGDDAPENAVDPAAGGAGGARAGAGGAGAGGAGAAGVSPTTGSAAGRGAGRGASSAGSSGAGSGGTNPATDPGDADADADAGASEGGAGQAGSTASAAGTSGNSGRGAAGMAGGGGSGGVPAAGSGGVPAAGSGGSTVSSAGAGGAGNTSTGFAPCPTGEPCKILPLGDSITNGFGYSGGYRVELFRRAHAAGRNITFTGSLVNGPMLVDGVAFPPNNEGHNGWKIDQLKPLIPDPAFQQTPHIILLMIGTNDLLQSDDLANAPQRLGALIDSLTLNAPNALIVVAKVTPLTSGSSGSAVQPYNAAIPALIDARVAAGKHLVLVDMFAGFDVALLTDGIHPNQQGYERVAGVWYNAISGLLH